MLPERRMSILKSCVDSKKVGSGECLSIVPRATLLLICREKATRSLSEKGLYQAKSSDLCSDCVLIKKAETAEFRGFVDAD